MRRALSRITHVTLSAVASFALTTALGACGENKIIKVSSSDGTEPDGAPTLADQIEIDQVAVFQSVKVTVLDNAAPKTANAPIIAGRPGMIRFHARTIEKGVKRPAPLTGEVRVKTPGREDTVIGGIVRKLVSLDDGDLDSTFTYELPPEAFAVGTTVSFTLKDAALPADPGVTLPVENGELALEVKDTATTLKVKIVPVRYSADGSKRTPDLSEKTLNFYRDSLYKMYPVAKVDMTVRDTIDWPLAVAPDGDGWDNLLDQIIKLRRSDTVADDVYYAAVFTPAASVGQYCKAGCILGVAPAQMRSEVGLRVAMIVGFGSRSEGGTLSQEIAHAMGRWHAPCGRPANIDTDYPYDGARLGVWGWDPLTKDMIDPDGGHYDFMSYCNPVWVSDYTFKGLWEAADAVQKSKRPDPTPTTPTDPGTDPAPAPSGLGTVAFTRPSPSRFVAKQLTSLLVNARGELTRGEPIDVVEEPTAAGSETTVTFEDAIGNVVGSAAARFRRTAGLRSGRLVLPEGVTVPAGAVRVRASDLETVMLTTPRVPR